MGYLMLANLLLVVHFGYVSFVVLGQLVILFGWILGWEWIRNFWFRLAHLAMIAVVALESVAGVQCPLTVWEQDLRRLGGEAISDAPFVFRLLNRLMFFDCIPYDHWIFQASYIGFALLVLATFVLVPPRWPRRGTQAPEGA